MPQGHDAGVCMGTDHQYWSYFVVWCPHHQHYVVHGSSHTETGTSKDPVDFVSRWLPLGPFDSRSDVVAQLEGWIAEDFD